MPPSEVKRKIGNRGLLLDIHGHAHTHNKTEFGYRIPGCQIKQMKSSSSSTRAQASKSSIFNLLNAKRVKLAEILVGPQGLGELLKNRGYLAIPTQKARPQCKQLKKGCDCGGQYFQGGHTIDEHGSKNGKGKVDAIQIEVPKKHRLEPAARTKYSSTLSKAIEEFWNKYYK